MNIKYFTFWGLLLLYASCTEEVVNTLTYPTTFTFNTPVLESRSVHRIDSFYTGTGADKVLNWNFTPIKENLGKFDRSNSVISDTLNYLIRKGFANNSSNLQNFPFKIQNVSMITSITLLSSNEMKISYGRLDIEDINNPLLDKIIYAEDTTFNYSAVGNFIIPGLYLNNDSRELYLCSEFIFTSSKSNTGREYKYHPFLSCNGTEPKSSLQSLVDKNKLIKYDTASVEYVNFIFSSYK